MLKDVLPTTRAAGIQYHGKHTLGAVLIHFTRSSDDPRQTFVSHPAGSRYRKRTKPIARSSQTRSCSSTVGSANSLSYTNEHLWVPTMPLWATPALRVPVRKPKSLLWLRDVFSSVLCNQVITQCFLHSLTLS